MEQTTGRVIKHRNILLVYVFGFITLGLYFIYWYISTKRDMVSLGAQIPHSILFFIPIINFYWHYKYAKGYTVVKGGGSPFLWFLLFVLVSIVTPGFVQSMLNKKATPKTTAPANAGQTGMPPAQPQNPQPPQAMMQVQATPAVRQQAMPTA